MFASSQWFLFLFLGINTCAKACKIAHQIFACKKVVLFLFIVFFFLCSLFGFKLSHCCFKKTFARPIMGSYINSIFNTLL